MNMQLFERLARERRVIFSVFMTCIVLLLAIGLS